MSGDGWLQTSSLDNTLVAVWSGKPTVARLNTLVQALRQTYVAHPEGVYLYNLITVRTAMPDKAARELLAKQFESMRGKLLAAAIVLEHSGIQYTLSRAVIATLMTITRNPFALKTFDDRAVAAMWLSGESGTSPPSIASLARDLEERLSTSVELESKSKLQRAST
jgi:hypothetical protein